ncbi:tetraacyldisaccharide 4'-kinase [Denitratisoma sp. DHT3]|uniref:tetraacyldisaccharide 4'-kinase n=1 Tax=Denitratisoma sp. DHT3 TaxID=1981880 RepID=UPI0011984ECB|nr:tetraacyldisaccharide 4'-kinase [Denitratisoma sp. DHT3]QDX82522.1 tetraacyldisaccharide 4'-kinase [Denitratisoma sp. DHT3]
MPAAPRTPGGSGLVEAWRSRGPAACLLLPLGLAFAGLAALRRRLYRWGLLRSERLPVPVVVVGNIIAGGAGKTPLTLYLAQRLRELGRRPGIVSRGYGGDGAVVEVRRDSAPDEVGDEPVLMKRRFAGPVFVGRRRAAAARALLAAYPDCDLILCDDGLQHYALARDVEIAVMDRRGLMNGWPLPAGPLREPPGRLREVQLLVAHGLAAPPDCGVPLCAMTLAGSRFVRLGDPAQHCDSAALTGSRLHAVAGLGEPQRFFDHLAALGLSCAPHAFPDHHRYVAADLDFSGDAILTTEKDAVKFPASLPLPVWILPVEAKLEPDPAPWVLDLLETAHGRPPA